MNPLTNMKNVKKLSEQELLSSHKTSWHDQYRDSAWIFIGGLPYTLTEGDLICIFSQYGEVVNINLVRDKDTGKSRGFCFLCYEDQRSTVLAVDNFNGIKILNRTIRVDHVNDYKMPKDSKKTDEVTKQLHAEGCAVKPEPVQLKPFVMEPQDIRETLVDQISSDIKLPMRLPIYTVKDETSSIISEIPVKIEAEKEPKKEKKHKKKKSKKKKKRMHESSSNSEDTPDEDDSKETHKKYKI